MPPSSGVAGGRAPPRRAPPRPRDPEAITFPPDRCDRGGPTRHALEDPNRPLHQRALVPIADGPRPSSGPARRGEIAPPTGEAGHTCAVGSADRRLAGRGWAPGVEGPRPPQPRRSPRRTPAATTQSGRRLCTPALGTASRPGRRASPPRRRGGGSPTGSGRSPARPPGLRRLDRTRGRGRARPEAADGREEEGGERSGSSARVSSAPPGSRTSRRRTRAR